MVKASPGIAVSSDIGLSQMHGVEVILPVGLKTNDVHDVEFLSRLYTLTNYVGYSSMTMPVTRLVSSINANMSRFV